MALAELSASLATLVGLICNFRQEKGGREQLDHRKFMEWLEYHRHEEMKTLICTTFHLQGEVDALLREDNAGLAEKLNGVESMLAQLLSRIDGFRPIVERLYPGDELSKQALEILTVFADSGGGILRPIVSAGVQGFWIMPTGRGQTLEYTAGEPAFLDDDIRTLCALGFLNGDCTSSGDAIYRFTRAGAAYVAQVKSAQKSDVPPVA